jgi:hypothetical protein
VRLVQQASSLVDLDMDVGGGPQGRDGVHQRILDAGRSCYAERHSVETELGTVTPRADVTIDDVLQRFPGTVDLYVAVLHHVQTILCQHLQEAAAREDGLAEAVGAMLDEIVRLDGVDPTLTRFLTSAAVECSRDGALRDATGVPWLGQEQLCQELVRTAVAVGEVHADDGETLVSVVCAMLVGLMANVHAGPDGQARAAEGLKKLLRGTLVKSPPPS